MIATLTHVTINTGHVAARPRPSADMVDHVRTWLAAGGVMGASGWTVCMVPAPSGAHCWDLVHQGERISTSLVCLDEAVAAALWPRLTPAALPGVALHRPAAPWLATILLLSPAILAAPVMMADVLAEAADLASLVAWAIID